MQKHKPRKPAVNGSIASDGRTNRERTRHWLRQYYRHVRDACKLAADFKTTTGRAMPSDKLGWMALAAEYGFPRWGEDDAYDEGAIYAWVVGRARAAPAAGAAVLTPDEAAILHELHGANTAKKQADIGIERDRKTIGEALGNLESLGLVNRPRGKRSGYGITPTGRTWIEQAKPGPD